MVGVRSPHRIVERAFDCLHLAIGSHTVPVVEQFVQTYHNGLARLALSMDRQQETTRRVTDPLHPWVHPATPESRVQSPAWRQLSEATEPLEKSSLSWKRRRRLQRKPAGFGSLPVQLSLALVHAFAFVVASVVHLTTPVYLDSFGRRRPGTRAAVSSSALTQLPCESRHRLTQATSLLFLRTGRESRARLFCALQLCASRWRLSPRKSE